MNKKLLRIAIFTLVLLLNLDLTWALDYKTYYECPTMMNYAPEFASYDKYIKDCEAYIKAGFPVSQGMTCNSAYQALYGDVNIDFQNGKCKPSRRKYINGTYGSTSCTLDFELQPSPRIVGRSSRSSVNLENSDNLEGVKCIDMLYKRLKSAYPNIQY